MNLPVAAERGAALRTMLDKQASEMSKLVPATTGLRPETIVRAVLTEVKLNPKLAACGDVSIIRSAMECAQLGLVPSRVTQHVHLVPFKDECVVIVGYKGLAQIAQRSGRVGEISAQIVYAADQFDWVLGDEESITHVPAWKMSEKERGVPVAYYCIVRDPAGRTMSRKVMSVREIDGVMAKAPSVKRPDSLWRTNYPAMALKTVVRRALALAPMALEDAALIDSASREEDVRADAEVYDAPVAPRERKRESVDASVADLRTRLREAIRRNPERAGELWGGAPPDIDTSDAAGLADLLKKVEAL